ncbi:D-mannonate oxidoreductase [Sulfitobacter sp. SK012]|uniref:mannitol dehydrogenase family protein n=1 Tax=Sulfitobacter sp. SK012 TaxID=1389005 RepID=UPI000E0AC501|nr:mannitol dehydrogenase family protein [Sulfitobacter sp. SK012]AXI47625.1 D-mannonate oxidoreductase [Sulfitobacter sp. SK012]
MQPTPILQFGTSRFLQAHADLFVSQAMEEGQDVGPITVVQSSGDPSRTTRLAALVGSYPVRIEGLVHGERVQETLDVKSVSRTLSTASQWDEVVRIFVQDAQIVLSNTGDAGFAPRLSDGSSTFKQAMSYPAKLTQLLRLRFAAGAAPIQIMPMELIVDNGTVLKARVMELAKDDAPDFLAYLERNVTWVNSLVDRIVSQPLEPAGAVAEAYALWAIEDQPGLVIPCRHPAVQVVASLADIEALKLFVLNLGHTFLADRWRARGGKDDVLVRHLVNDANELGQLRHVLHHEVRTAFVAADLAEQFDAYVITTLERFANPFLDHRIADIAQNHPQKVARRIAAMLAWAKDRGDLSPKPILAAIVATHKEHT